MPKRHTSNFKNSAPRVLHLKVRSPRIYWCMTYRFLGNLLRTAVVFAILGGIVWGIVHGLRRTVVHNDEFQIQLIDLNPNRVLDEQRLIEIGGINPNGNIFDVDLDALEKKLNALPEIAAAHAERELPGTLHIRVIERDPIAWIEIPALGIPGRNLNEGLLLDERSVVFPCPKGMVDLAAGLPVVVLATPDIPTPKAGEKFEIPELTHAIELLNLCRSAAGSDEFPIDRIEPEKDWSMLVHMRNGVVARFGLLDQQRQVADLIAALRYAEKRKYELATIDLIPQRNIPVTFASPPPPPPPLPRAIPVAVAAGPSGPPTATPAACPAPAKAAPVQSVPIKVTPAKPAPAKTATASSTPAKSGPATTKPVKVKPNITPPGAAPKSIPRAIIIDLN